ncbi:MAG: type secretion system protein [Rhodospirillales bacterium]|nr:type secretion system protein [Rhodospirillales bacterium]
MILHQPNLLLPSIAIFVAVVCAIYGIATFILTDNRLRRLESGTPVAAGVSIRKGGSLLERLASRSLGSRLAPSDERERASLKLWLIRAGYDSPAAVQAYYGIRLILAFGLGVAALSIIPIALPRQQANSMLLTGALLGGVIGFMAPVVWMSRRKAVRQRQIREGLPHIIDLLLVCTEAGLGLDTAIARVGEEFSTSQPVLAEQLNLISSELRAGRPRAVAFRGFADRAGVQQVSSLVNLLVQSDMLGTSMAGTLRVFSADMRDHQLLKAEELAQKVSAKLSIVLVGCFMPALIIAIIAPIIFHIVATWQDIPM